MRVGRSKRKNCVMIRARLIMIRKMVVMISMIMKMMIVINDDEDDEGKTRNMLKFR